jgi:hypothetical protein
MNTRTLKSLIKIASALLLAPLAALHAEAPDPGQYSAEQFEVKATRGTGLIGTEHPWFNDLIHWRKTGSSCLDAAHHPCRT